MSTEDDLLSNFFAEIDKLPTNTTSTPKEENDVIVTNTKFVECSDPAVNKPITVPKPKPKLETAYIPPKFAEVDPEIKKKERLEKFFKNEVENKKKSNQHRRRANGQSWVDPTYPVVTLVTFLIQRWPIGMKKTSVYLLAI